MFKRIVAHKGFWFSVLFLGLIYAVILFLLQWAFIGFPPHFFEVNNILTVIITFGIIAFICGFSISYAKFYKKMKQEDSRR